MPVSVRTFGVIQYTYSKSPAIIGLQKKSLEACFHVRYRACSSAANLSALLFKVDFPLSNSERKFVRQYKIISW